MKKIAFLNIYQGIVERGAETLVDNIASGLSDEFDITVFSGKNVTKRPYKTIVVPTIWNLTVDVSRSSFLRILRKFYLDPYSLEVFWFTLLCLPKLFSDRFEVIFSINGFWQMVLLRILRFFTRVKIISTGFAGVGKDSYWNVKLATDAFVAMTNFAAEWARDINPKIKISAIGGGVDLKRFTPDGKVENLDLERPITLCVSALIPYKGVDLTIRAVSKLKKGSLVIIGDGYEKEKLQNLGEGLLGQKRFRILKVPYAEIEKYYRFCDVFTLASESSEAFGIVYLEAMASGKPAVGPDDEVRREVIGEGGIFVDVYDAEKYASGLKLALEKDWGNLIRKQAEKFSWDKIVSQYKEVIKKL